MEDSWILRVIRAPFNIYMLPNYADLWCPSKRPGLGDEVKADNIQLGLENDHQDQEVLLNTTNSATSIHCNIMAPRLYISRGQW